MKIRGTGIINALLACMMLSSTVPGQFHKLETDDLTLIYLGKPSEYVVPHLARCFENSLRYDENLFHYTPSEKVTVYLHDFSDYHNAGATAVPRNYIEVNLAPANYVFETIPANERMNHTTSHELIHIVTTDQATGTDQFFRSAFFGKVWPTAENPTSILYSYLASPRKLSPRWYLEGLAVFWETWMAGGLGRAMGSYDEMVFRSMVLDSSYIYDVVGLESEGTTIDFNLGANSYLYGTRFISYMALQYGPEKVLEWAERDKGSKRYFASNFKRVFGSSLDHEWSHWINWEHEWQRANLDSIRLNPTTPYRPLSNQALGSVSRDYFDKEKQAIYAAVNYPGQIAHVAAIDIKTGKVKKICEVKGAARTFVSSIAFDPAKQQIFFTTDINQWRDLNVVSLKTGKTKRLMEDARTGDLTFNDIDKSIWGVRHYNGISTLVRIPYPYSEWNQIYSFPYGQDIFDTDISPDGTLITAGFVDISGRQKLIRMNIQNLMSGEKTYDVLFDFENNLPQNFVFSQDGKYLFGSSYYSGVSNIYRYDFLRKDMNILTNCETGFFRPIPVSQDSLIVMRYTGRGFTPAMIANDTLKYVSAINFLGNEIVQKYPIVRDWKLGPPSSINIDSLTTSFGKYSPIGNTKLNSLYPIIEGYKVYSAFGLRTDFSDLLRVTSLNFTGSYTPEGSIPDKEKFHASLKAHYWGWKLTATYNKADFYDLFGPTKTSRKGYSAGLQYQKSLLYDEPKTLYLTTNVTWFGNLERLPDFQNINATFDRLLSTKATLDYEYVRQSLGAVDDEKGIKWQLVAQNNYVNKKNYPRIYTNLDYGIPLPIGHSSIWIRNSAGYSFGERNNPFANFFFGGFGNNWVDYQTEKRYREYYSFPGVELNEIAGKNYVRAMVEWSLPPIRFRRIGSPSFYMRWAHPTLFISGIRTNLDAKSSADNLQFGTRRTLTNFGGQIDFRIVIFSRFNSTLSFGYAAAVEENQPLDKANTEFMISLKIL